MTSVDNNASQESILSWTSEEKHEKESGTKILLSQCFEDSPMHRDKIKDCEESIDLLQNTIRNIIKSANQAVSYAKGIMNIFIKFNITSILLMNILYIYIYYIFTFVIILFFYALIMFNL